MRRRVRAVSIVMMMMLLGGCAASGTPSSAASPTAAPDTATSAPPSTPAPTSTVTGDPSRWLIGEDTLGPLQLGMPFADALRALPEAEDACGWAYVDRRGGADDGLWITNTDEALSMAQWSGADGPRTAEGLGVGSTRGEVRAIHPAATSVPQNLEWLQSGNVIFGFVPRVTHHADGTQTDERSDGDLVVAVGVTAIGPQYEFCG